MAIERPAALFDRVTEWDDLVRFATEPTTSFRIGVVSGRRRQGKSFILDEVSLRIPAKAISQSGVFDHPRSEAAERPTLGRGSPPDDHLLSGGCG